MFRKLKKSLFPSKYLLKALLNEKKKSQDILESQLLSIQKQGETLQIQADTIKQQTDILHHQLHAMIQLKHAIGDLKDELEMIRRKDFPIYYKDVDGWFDFPELYRFLVNQLVEGDSVVEVGCWLGKSIVFLGQEVKRRGFQNIAIYAVDPWIDMNCEDTYDNFFKRCGGDVYHIFESNIRCAGISSLVKPIKKPSLEVAAGFSEKARFVFIDGDHRYEAVLNDIDAWIKHVKPDGYLTGHDYFQPQVEKAVRERFKHFDIVGPCWLAHPKDYIGKTIID